MHATDCTGCPNCNTEFAALLREQNPHALSRRLAAGTAKAFRLLRLARTAAKTPSVPAPPIMTDYVRTLPAALERNQTLANIMLRDIKE